MDFAEPAGRRAVRTRMKSILLVPVFAIAAFVSSCATFRASREISVSLVNLVPTNVALFETGATLTLRVTNETPEPLTFAGASHRLFLNGTYVGVAVSNQRFTVPALSTATQTVSAYLENLAVLRKITQMSNSPTSVISYRLESQLHAEGGRRGQLGAVAAGELDIGALAGAVEGARPVGR